MMRVMGIVVAALVTAQLVCPGAQAETWHKPRHKLVLNATASEATTPGGLMPPVAAPLDRVIGAADVPGEAKVAHRARHPHRTIIAKPNIVKPEDEEPAEPAAGYLPKAPSGVMSPQQEMVRHIALMNGDRKFIMVDKRMGKILLFEDGNPVFIGNVLTGQSYADRLPSNELGEKFDNLNAMDTKVTPAGRFTVTRGYNKEYGPLFDVNQIKGKDWGIAIHQVYLGIPSEHRATRLRSPREDDKNITFGCINVEPDTINLFLRELPEKAPTVLYVLPRDETQTAAYLASRNS
jgi:hypothetical protein